MSKNRLPRFSIVICSYNGAATLADTLTAVTAQEYGAKLDILVVDDGSSDETAQIASSFADVRVITNATNQGLAGSRNVGIAAAYGEIVAFTDDDCVPSPTWIKELAAAYTDENVWGVGGTVASTDDNQTVTLRYLQESKPLAPLENTLNESHSLPYRFGLYVKGILGIGAKKEQPDENRSVYSLVGANMSFRKAILKEVEGFDERFRFGAEEEELCKRLNALKPGCLIYAPASTMLHHFEPELHDSLRRSRAYGKGNARMSLKHSDVRPIIYPFPLLIALLPLLGLLNPLLLLAPLLVIPFIYGKWLRLAWQRKKLEPVLYGFIQCLQEWYGNIGFVQGYWEYLPVFKGARFGRLQQLVRIVTPAAALIATLLASHAGNLTWTKLPLAIAMLMVPGYLALRALKVHLATMAQAAMATVLGTGIVMGLGLLSATLLPVFGIEQPLRFWPFVGVYGAGLLALIIAAAQAPQPDKPVVRIKKSVWHWLFYIAASAVPLLAFVGANMLNSGRSNTLTVTMFILATLVLAVGIWQSKRLSSNALPFALFAVSLGSLWSYALRSAYVFGWDIQQEFHVFLETNHAAAWNLGQVHTPYDAMLSLTVLPTALSQATGLSGEILFKVFYPLVFSFLPVLLYYTYKLFTKNWIAFTGAALTIAQFYYMQQFAALARQQVAFLFFAAALFVLLHDKISPNAKRWIILSSFAGLVVSHYSTTYATIALIGGAWLLSKIVSVIHRDPLKDVVKVSGYLKWWMVASLLVGAVLWYGPATHSSAALKEMGKSHDFSKALEAAEESLDRSNKASDKDYLSNIGPDYRTQHRYYTYYEDGDNSTIKEVPQQTIPERSFWYPVSQLADAALRYSWWLVAFGGIAAFLFAISLHFNKRLMELGMLGLVASGLFVAVHTIPDVEQFYNISRMNQQMLIIIAIPALLSLAWLLQRFSLTVRKLVIGGMLVVSFLIASGLSSQFAGGNAAANLNNSGTDYQRFYMQQTDIAAVTWLDGNYDRGVPIYTDRYNALHFTVPTAIRSGLVPDITPETLAIGAYVYADSTNLKDGVAMSQYKGEIIEYQFPKDFITTHKNTLYSNGKAEIYR